MVVGVAGNQLEIGDVIKVLLPKHSPSGHEQEGRRPALVVGTFTQVGAMRFPMVMIAPMTTQIASWTTQNPSLYPRISSGTAGLTEESVILLDQIRAVSLSRMLSFLGTLDAAQLEPINRLLSRVFLLPIRSPPHE